MAETLHIDRIGHRGDGVADTADGALFVPYTLPGEDVSVDEWPGHPDRRHLVRVDQASPERIAPICPHFGTCGGCAMQHWDTARYRDWKTALVTEALAQVGLAAALEPLIDAHGAGRRRVVFHARRSTADIVDVGFAALRAHHIVSIDRCPILAPDLSGAIPLAWAVAEALTTMRKPLDIQITATETALDVDIRGSGPLSPGTSTALARVAERHRVARLTRHGDLITQRAVPMITIGRAHVALPPGSFLQPTVAGETALAALVAGHCEGARNVVDLFCGVGPFALRLAEHARVNAVDSEAEAVAALARAAANTSGLKPVTTEARDLFRRPLQPAELKRVDVVVFDPPRQGALAQARELAASTVERVVAVSCNAATLARDARILVDGGYRLVTATPVDQFRYSPHVEIVALFER